MARLDILYLSTADHGQERPAPQVRISSLEIHDNPADTIPGHADLVAERAAGS